MSERLRAWTESIETFYLENVLEERGGKRASVVRALLYAVSRGFQVAIVGGGESPEADLERALGMVD